MISLYVGLLHLDEEREQRPLRSRILHPANDTDGIEANEIRIGYISQLAVVVGEVNPGSRPIDRLAVPVGVIGLGLELVDKRRVFIGL